MPDAAPFKRLLDLLGRNGDTNIRILRSDPDRPRAIQLAYDQVGDALAVAEQEGWSLWFEVQPSGYEEPMGRSKAADIEQLVAIYADIDFKPAPEGMGSIPAAEDLLHDLEGALGTPPACVVATGHGLQPYWLIEDGFIDDDSRDRVAGILRRWGKLVQTLAQALGGNADNVYDLPRILRVPGSINFKDPSHPVPTAWEFGPEVRYSLNELDEILDAHGIDLQSVEVATEIASPSAQWEWAEHDCDFSDVIRGEISVSVPTGRHPWGLKIAAILYGMVRSGCVTEETFYELRDRVFIPRLMELGHIQQPIREVTGYEIAQILRWGQLQAESWSKSKLGEEMRNHVHRDFVLGVVSRETQLPDHLQQTLMQNIAAARDAEVTATADAPEPAPVLATVSSIFGGHKLNGAVDPANPVTDGSLALDVEVRIRERMGLAAYTDTGNGERLAAQLRGKYIYVPQLGWHYWDGTRYVPDTLGAVVEQAKDLFMSMLRQAQDPVAVKWAHSSLNRARISSAVDFAKTTTYLALDAGDLDRNGFELATPAGVVDLRTAALRDGDPLVDRHTLSTAYAPDFEMPTPRFDEFLRFALIDDEMISYIRRLFGAAAIGKVLWHIFPIFLGVGANGKTTLLDICAGVLGQYAIAMPKNFLVEKRGDQHPTEIAQLRAIRLATNSEVPAHAAFDETLVKTLTGEQRLRGRLMGKDFFSFENMATQFLAANHLPAVRAGGTGFFRRARKIDFRNVMPDAKQNIQLVQDILTTEGPGVLAWMIRGAGEALRDGLRDPAQVMVATRAYQLEEDSLARFLTDHVHDMPGVEVTREALFDRYRYWSMRYGSDTLTFVKFCREVTQLLPLTNRGGNTVFTNIAFNSVDVVQEEE
jgi:P4 family phage/plasmid primase-like protien